LPCADGAKNYQCRAGHVDLSKLGVAEVQDLFHDEMLTIYGKLVADRTTDTLSIQPTRAFENISEWYDNGERPNISGDEPPLP
jgi:hypothetical protein